MPLVQLPLDTNAGTMNLANGAIANPFENQGTLRARDLTNTLPAPGPQWEVYIQGGRTATGTDAVTWAREGEKLGVLAHIYGTIRQRKANPHEGSYVAGLFDRGPNAILKKIGEESAEVVMAGKEGERRAIVFEVADLWFHTLILLGLHDIDPQEVARELRSRIGKRRPS